MALSVALLVCAGLMARSAWEIARDHPGFEPGNVLQADLGTDLGNLDPRARDAFDEALLARASAIPGVQGAALTEGHLLGMGGPKGVGVVLEGADQMVPVSFPRLVVGPGFFATLGIPLAGGREFTTADRRDGEPVALVNETLASQAWPSGRPVGGRIRVNGEWRHVVGVCGDFKYKDWSDPPRPFVFLPFAQWDAAARNVLVKTGGPAAASRGALLEALSGLDGSLPIQVRNLEAIARSSSFLVRTSAAALGILGGLALFMATLGVYGVMSHAVRQRTAEIGIRMALGARPALLLGMVLRQGLAMVLPGVVLGLAAARVLAMRFADCLHRTSPTDPWVFIGVPAILMAVALAACVLPAARAATLDPLDALREG
jgi:predicted permease